MVRSINKSVLCDIPQGSILRLMLFLLYINDLANISKKFKFILFANDTNVLYADKNLLDVMGVLNYELKYLSVWFKVNKLSLNVGKTNYMIFKHKNDKINNKIIIDDVRVENKVNVLQESTSLKFGNESTRTLNF